MMAKEQKAAYAPLWVHGALTATAHTRVNQTRTLERLDTFLVPSADLAPGSAITCANAPLHLCC